MAGEKTSAFRPWSEGVDEAVFIAFNPAYRLPDIDPEALHDKLDAARGWSRHGPYLQDTVSRLFDPLPPDRARALCDLDGWHSIAAKHERRLVSWLEMQTALGIADIRDFELLLREATGNLAVSERSQYIAAFERYVEQEGIFLPTDCEIQPCMETLIGAAFQNAGCARVSFSDEFISYRAEMSVNALLHGPSISIFDRPLAKPPGALWSESAGLACYVAFDSVVTVFRGRLNAMRTSRIDELLEGVWASSDDDPLWNFSWPFGLFPSDDIGQAS